MRILLLASALALGACAPEGDPRIEVQNAWARPALAAGHSSAAYMTIRNSGAGPDKLTAVTSGSSEQVGLHRSANEGGIATMRSIEGGLEIAGGASAQFAPGGNHLMIEKVSRPLKVGDRIRLVLRFERSGERAVEVVVRQDASVHGHSGH